MAYDSIWYVPLIKPVFLGLHGKFAYIQPYDDSILPTTNKYYLGGDYTIRGFEYRSVGPKNKRGVVIGGNKLVLFNAELTVPFSEVFRFVVFYDIGNVFREQEDIRFDELRDSAGLEVRITIPAIYLPIRFIYAWNLHPEEDEDDSQFSFGFGTTF